LLSRLDLRPADAVMAEMATSFAVSYRLRAADAFHLATAVATGADRFITNNRKDFGPSITEVEVVYPDALDE
jgi:predicted nucleic acid-binding protein